MEPRTKKTTVIIAVLFVALIIAVAVFNALRPVPSQIMTDLPSVTSEPGVVAMPAPPNVSPLPELTGLTEQQAATAIEDSGRHLRVTSRDGESFPVTADYQPDRVNLNIVDGRIRDYNVG